jgi:hypothetical protein
MTELQSYLQIIHILKYFLIMLNEGYQSPITIEKVREWVIDMYMGY